MVQEAAERLLARNIPQAEKQAVIGLVNLVADHGLIDPDTGRAFTRIQTGIVSSEIVPTEARRFSDGAREALSREGYVIYALSGQSIRTLRESDRKFWSIWHGGSQYEAFETKGSMVSEVAIKPDALFIRGSNNKTLKQQKDLIAKFSTGLGKEIKGVEAIMGEAPDYVELAFAHLDATDDRLFGEKYDYKYARTKTPTVVSDVASVGSFVAVNGLRVDRWYCDDGRSFIFASPLVVPKS